MPIRCSWCFFHQIDRLDPKLPPTFPLAFTDEGCSQTRAAAAETAIPRKRLRRQAISGLTVTCGSTVYCRWVGRTRLAKGCQPMRKACGPLQLASKQGSLHYNDKRHQSGHQSGHQHGGEMCMGRTLSRSILGAKYTVFSGRGCRWCCRMFVHSLVVSAVTPLRAWLSTGVGCRRTSSGSAGSICGWRRDDR
jgi:hypothetical protein